MNGPRVSRINVRHSTATVLALGFLLAPASTASPATTPRVTIARGAVAYHGLVLSKEPARRPVNIAVAYGGPEPAYQITDVGWRAGEPTIAVDARGVAYYDVARKYETQVPQMSTAVRAAVFLRSTDGGVTWRVVQPPLAAGQGEGHPWFFDPYVYGDEHTGRIFEGTLTDAGGSYFDFTDDGGKTWTRADMYVPGINDHETLFSGAVPPHSGLTVSDPRFGRIVYYCVNQLIDTACARSLDGGRTFVPTGSFAAVPFATHPQQFGCEGYTGHGVADPQGRIFLPWMCGRPGISVSTDAGSSWQQYTIDPNSDIGGAGRTINTSVAVDDAGTLYYVWWDQRYLLPYLSISTDHGRTWSPPRMVAPPGVVEVNDVNVDAGAAGRIAISFVGTRRADHRVNSGPMSQYFQPQSNRPWNHYMVLSTDALSSDPTFLSTVTNPGGPSDPIHRGACQGPCGGMLDFLSNLVAPDGHGTVWATAVDTCTALQGCNGPKGTGAEAVDAEGIAIRQIAGPWLR